MTTAIYLRLSLEDDDLVDGKQESESISNQRNLLLDYIRDSPELCRSEVLEFSDDGYSGKNFDRPGVQRLLEAAKQGMLQCILVKDLSRFGRDYMIVGNYISRVFPFLGVRFIAVNDHFDSSRKGDIDSLDTAFKTMIYDFYSRDISQKVRSAKKRLAERGVYINPVAPYGYRKAPEDRHILLADPETAPVVRRIFEMIASGTSSEETARILNVEGVPTPSQAKAGTSSGHANWHAKYWRPQMVDWIIRDRQYIGSTVFGRHVRNQIGVRRQTKALQRDWIVVDDRHEPLVTKELFQRAQEQLGGAFRQKGPYEKWDTPLRKKVYCGECGYAIVRRGGKSPYYCCMTPRRVPDLSCYQEKITEDEIIGAVIEAIRIQAQCALNLKDVLEQQRKKQTESLGALREALQKTRTRQEQIAHQSEQLYEDFFDGTISREAYARQKAVLLKCQKAAEEEEAELKLRLDAYNESQSSFVEKYQDHARLTELTPELAADLLDRVTVWPDGKLEITLNYIDQISSLVLEDVSI